MAMWQFYYLLLIYLAGCLPTVAHSIVCCNTNVKLLTAGTIYVIIHTIEKLTYTYIPIYIQIYLYVVTVRALKWSSTFSPFDFLVSNKPNQSQPNGSCHWYGMQQHLRSVANRLCSYKSEKPTIIVCNCDLLRWLLLLATVKWSIHLVTNSCRYVL